MLHFLHSVRVVRTKVKMYHRYFFGFSGFGKDFVWMNWLMQIDVRENVDHLMALLKVVVLMFHVDEFDQ